MTERTNGRHFHEPANLTEALNRLDELLETERSIEADLGKTPGADEAARHWRHRAKRKLEHVRNDKRRLKAWLSEHDRAAASGPAASDIAKVLAGRVLRLEAVFFAAHAFVTCPADGDLAALLERLRVKVEAVATEVDEVTVS